MIVYIYIYKTKKTITKHSETPGTFVEEKTNQCRKKEGGSEDNSLRGRGGGGGDYLGLKFLLKRVAWEKRGFETRGGYTPHRNYAPPKNL